MQVQDLRLDRHVQRRGRLVAHQEVRLGSPGRARWRSAAADRRRTRAGTVVRQRRDSPTWASSSPTRARTCARSVARPKTRIGSAMIRSTRQRGLRLAYGSWKIICSRDAAARSRAACEARAMSCPSNSIAARAWAGGARRRAARRWTCRTPTRRRARTSRRGAIAKLTSSTALQELARLPLDHAIQPGRRHVEVASETRRTRSSGSLGSRRLTPLGATLVQPAGGPR